VTLPENTSTLFFWVLGIRQVRGNELIFRRHAAFACMIVFMNTISKSAIRQTDAESIPADRDSGD